MDNQYVYRKTVRGRRYNRFRRRFRLTLFLILVIIAVILFFLFDNGGPTSSGVSKIENTVISDNLQTTVSPYFKFQDTGKWVLDTGHSTPTKWIYGKSHKLDPVATLIVWVNETPIPLDLAAPRVLPVRIVNGNSFDVTQISDPCGKTYGDQPHKVKIVNIDEALMLCDPDSPQYFVQLAQITGDYKLTLHRVDGTPVQFVIVYKDSTLDPKSSSLLLIGKTFQSL
jgi:hypothetical protein